jgi:hypothetical protein
MGATMPWIDLLRHFAVSLINNTQLKYMKHRMLFCQVVESVGFIIYYDSLYIFKFPNSSQPKEKTFTFYRSTDEIKRN